MLDCPTLCKLRVGTILVLTPYVVQIKVGILFSILIINSKETLRIFVVSPPQAFNISAIWQNMSTYTIFNDF
jgi:hypothetical protein